MKFKNHHGIIFHPTDWIAGVDYANENQNDLIKDEEDKEYEEENLDYNDFNVEEEYYDRDNQQEIKSLLLTEDVSKCQLLKSLVAQHE